MTIILSLLSFAAEVFQSVVSYIRLQRIAQIKTFSQEVKTSEQKAKDIDTKISAAEAERKADETLPPLSPTDMENYWNKK